MSSRMESHEEKINFQKIGRKPSKRDKMPHLFIVQHLVSHMGVLKNESFTETNGSKAYSQASDHGGRDRGGHGGHGGRDGGDGGDGDDGDDGDDGGDDEKRDMHRHYDLGRTRLLGAGKLMARLQQR